ncbi:Predicted nucleotidyltransferase component of viral defense system [Butyrivibrio fibrisolvens]|uniref:Predicted nucleotidyltransferase component of viral defense system n=1 Tax=Butyrivibrio fibrisolvens TaxID=831 RepID=A0A1H9XCM3_BUTFI|nr:nucleotidyl transferase AbiEii/AbiGii toxin family protein [Butyrivibrio fibrisolvens]SES43874.1 Predicted nucleotidyltransferase component of viral defense system [Butyrivibrio fibrisolvens]
MLLHKDREQFEAIVNAASNELSIPIPIVEKDYYVTMILKQLSLNAKNCVFKGGTSLSKCHHAIDRFSEDIDITFSDTLSQGERKKLKNNVIAGISEYLELPIPDWNNAHSRRDYNCYVFHYSPIEGYVPESLIDGVKMEVVLGSIAFPTVEMEVDSYIYQVLKKDNMDLVELYELQPFTMTIQSLERTFIDKVFALCDYYIKGDVNKHSRHIYDLYMLMPKMTFDEGFKELVKEVRIERQKKPELCPSSLDGVDINDMLGIIIAEAVYEKDYESITSYFQKTRIEYEKAIEAVKKVIELKAF